MFRLMGFLGDSAFPPRVSLDTAIGDVRRTFEERTEASLRQMYTRVSEDLAAEYTELRKKAQAQVAVLAKLAGVDDIAVPAEVDEEIGRIAGRVAWRLVAQAATLELLDTARSLAQPFPEAEPMPTDWWVKGCLERLNRDEFVEDTGLEGDEVDLAVGRTAVAILKWPELEEHIPMFFRGDFLTVAATPDGVVLSSGAPLVLVTEPGEPLDEDPVSEIFVRFEPEEGVAVLATKPEVDVALVGARDEGRLMEVRRGDTRLLVYEAGNMLQVGFPVAEGGTGPGPAERTRATGHVSGLTEVAGSVVWDPQAVEVQTAGPAVLFKPKIGEHGFQTGTSEGLVRAIGVAKDAASDVHNAALFIKE